MAMAHLDDEMFAASAEIDRLNELRRWRPMTEHPVDDRWVLVRTRNKADAAPVTWFSSEEVWHAGRHGCPPNRAFLPDVEWCYIPGQEPEDLL